VLNGDSPPLISADRLTVPALLKHHGYATACMGKWHLGLTLPKVAEALTRALLEGPEKLLPEWNKKKLAE